MKRLVVLAVVALLVVTAGCGMTSQAARDAQASATTTTSNNPADTAPVGAMLPDGYTQNSLEDPELAYQQHMDALENDSYQVRYSVRGAQDDSLHFYALTNVSVSEERFRAWTFKTGAEGNVTEQIYQDETTRYRQIQPENGPTTIESANRTFEPVEGTYEDRSLRTLLENIEISGAQPSQSGESYIVFSVDSYNGESVERAHLFVYPSGRIWGLMLTLEDEQILYITRQHESITVAEPTWIGNGTADS